MQRADLVVRAPADGVPVMLLEIDHRTDAHPALRAVLTTHDIAWADDDGEAQLSDNGRRLWDGLIRGNDQIFPCAARLLVGVGLRPSEAPDGRYRRRGGGGGGRGRGCGLPVRVRPRTSARAGGSARSGLAPACSAGRVSRGHRRSCRHALRQATLIEVLQRLVGVRVR